MGDLGSIRRALVVGLGRSGRAAIVALAGAGVEVTATDDDPGVDGDALPAGVAFRRGVDVAELFESVDLVVPSPGVPEHAELLVAAATRGVPIWSEPELGWRLSPRRIVAITGTNGKTSTTELVTAMLLADGQDAIACGNIGMPLVEAAAASAPDATLVAELSSFQLRYSHTLRPQVGMLLNFADDHLDWHGSVAAYMAAKERLWQAQRDDDWAVANADDPAALAMAMRATGSQLAVFSGGQLPGAHEADSTWACGTQVGVGVRDGKLVSTIPVARGTILRIADLPDAAPHHLQNVAAAACAALLAGASHASVAAAALDWVPGRHRMELVAVGRGMRWINDSKATNPHAAAAALDAAGPSIWIAGGLAKGVDLTPLGAHLGAVRVALLIGEAAPQLAAVCQQQGVATRMCDSLEQACDLAADLGVEGDSVLLAPGCASFDQFRDYADRGDRFVAAVRDILG